MQETYIVFWSVLTVVMLITEAVTFNLVTIWFAAGALAAVIAAARFDLKAEKASEAIATAATVTVAATPGRQNDTAMSAVVGIETKGFSSESIFDIGTKSIIAETSVVRGPNSGEMSIAA